MCSWITAVFISAVSWGAADIVFDVILPSEHDLPHTNKSTTLSHAQTMLLCALTTYMIIFVYITFMVYSGETYLYFLDGGSLLLLQIDYSKIILLIISGIFSYYHYHFIIRAFEYSSSTIILPFLQFSSIFAFSLSIFQKWFQGRPYLTNPFHLLAYIMILLGGLTPATNGNLLTIFTRAFWTQPFVKYAIIADLSHAVYTVCVSYAGDIEEGGRQFSIYTNMEFFILTRMMFVMMFFIRVYRSQMVQQECLQVIHKPKLLVIGTVLGEILTLIGYFASVYAYQCYYQPGVVSASESSLNLVSNLFMAYFLKRFYNIGKQASLQNLGLKLISSITISLGLVMAST